MSFLASAGGASERQRWASHPDAVETSAANVGNQRLAVRPVPPRLHPPARSRRSAAMLSRPCWTFLTMQACPASIPAGSEDTDGTLLQPPRQPWESSEHFFLLPWAQDKSDDNKRRWCALQ